MTFVAARIPFAVTPKYRIRADLFRLDEPMFGDESARHFILDAEYPDYLSTKLAQLTPHAAQCRCGTKRLYDAPDFKEALDSLAETLAEEHPGWFVKEGETYNFPALGVTLKGEALRHDIGAPLAEAGKSLTAHLHTLPFALRRAEALALAVQEDLVVMSHAKDRDEACWLHVCFPSGWDPASRLGSSFADIHRPVAHSERLSRAAPQVMRALLTKGPFKRYVWSLVPDAQLSRNPALGVRPATPFDTPADLAAQLFFRVERQTTLALTETYSLFTIRIYRQPLTEALRERSDRENLAAALESMDDETLIYKGLEKWRAPLLEWLRA